MRIQERTMGSAMWASAAALALTLGVPSSGAFPVITNVVETGGDNEATDTVTAKWTGVTFSNGVANEYLNPFTVPFFGEGVPAYVDRVHQWEAAGPAIPLPPYLAGGEYIMIGNDNRDNTALRLDVSVATSVEVFLLIDNRLSDGSGANPPTFGPANMQWVLDEAWTPVMTGLNRNSDPNIPDEVGVDESADGSLNQWSSIYTKIFPAGTFQLKQADNAGRNMYGVVIKEYVVIPDPPTGLAAISGDTKVTLSWDATLGATGYTVKRSTSSGGPYENVAAIASTSYVDAGRMNDVTYYYVVSASGLGGEGGNSAEVSATPKAAPQNMVATGGVNEVELNWTALPGAASYTVKRSETMGGPYTTIASGLAAPGFRDSSVQSGRTYYYVVLGQLAAGGESGQPDEVSATTAPSAPHLAAAIWAATVQRISWTTPDRIVSQFVLEQSTDGASFTPLATLPSNQRSYTNSGLTMGTTYHYRVQAQNVTGPSAYSAVASATAPVMGLNVNFASASNNSAGTPVAPIPTGYLQDIGELFGDRGNGFSYGWDRDITVDSRWRISPAAPDLRYETLNHFQKAIPSAIWEIAIPNGYYWVHVVSGDPTAVDSVFQHSIEGVITPALTPGAGRNWHEFTNTVVVNDGRLTITTGPLGANNKINYVDVYPAVALPVVITTQPQAQSAEENRPLILTVGITNGPVPAGAQFFGIEPLSYQWHRDGSPVADQTNATLNIPRAQVSDSGSYQVVIMNVAGSITSETASVTVNEDTTPPRLVSAGSVDGRTIMACFNETMEPTSGILDPFNWQFDDGTVYFARDNVRLSADGKTIVLTLADGLQIPGEFTLTSLAARDLAQNQVAPPGNRVQTRVSGFNSQDVGGPGRMGLALTCDGQEFEIIGGGADIWGASDQFHLVSKSFAGDFDARVRVTALAGSNAITKAVLVARETTNPDARALHISVNPTPPARNQIELGLRSTVGGGTAAWGSTFVPASIPNAWMRITRQGNVFTGYRSSNGVDWVQMGMTTQTFPSAMIVGIGVTAHDNSLLATGKFSNFTLTRFVTPPSIGNLSHSAGTFGLSFHTQSGVEYKVEYKNNLEDPSWTPLATVTGNGMAMTVTDPSAADRRFYRVRID